MSLDKHKDEHNGQGVSLETVIYREKMVEKHSNDLDMLEVPIFKGASAGFCRLMTKLMNSAHSQRSKQYVGEYLSDTAPYMFIA